jgi:Protein of unknown function (DUF4236)
MCSVLLRKTFGVGPFRFTVSRKGVSESAGGRWWRLTAGGAGPRYSFRVPGTGISVRRRIKRR